MINRIILNETSYFGRGSREKLPEEIKARNLHKALLVTDNGLLKTDVVVLIMRTLEKASVGYVLFSDIHPNPSVKNVQDGLKVAKEYNVDCVVAVGGGSSIDTAKAIAVIMTNPENEDVVSLETDDKSRK